MSNHPLTWQLFKEGNRAAYSELYTQHFSFLYNYGHKFTGDTEMIEDCIHDLFTKLWSDKSRLGDPVSVKNYLYKSFRHTILDKLAKLRNHNSLTEDYSFQYEVGYDSVISERESRDELRVQMQSIIDQLPARQKEIIYLRFYEGMSYEEIAELMEITVSSSYKLLYKAVSRLQESLNVSKLVVIAHLIGAFYLHFPQEQNIF